MSGDRLSSGAEHPNSTSSKYVVSDNEVRGVAEMPEADVPYNLCP